VRDYEIGGKMKYKYTGTEEQLIEAGFEPIKDKLQPQQYFWYRKIYKSTRKYYIEILIWIKCGFTDEWVKNIEIEKHLCNELFCYSTKKINSKRYIQDLIEKGLVEEQND